MTDISTTTQSTGTGNMVFDQDQSAILQANDTFTGIIADSTYTNFECGTYTYQGSNTFSRNNNYNFI